MEDLEIRAARLSDVPRLLEFYKQLDITPEPEMPIEHAWARAHVHPTGSANVEVVQVRDLRGFAQALPPPLRERLRPEGIGSRDAIRLAPRQGALNPFQGIKHSSPPLRNPHQVQPISRALSYMATTFSGGVTDWIL